MSPLSSRPMLRQSLPHAHPQPDFRVRSRHCSPVCPFVAAALFSPCFVFLLPIPSPLVHRANLAPRPHQHAPTPAKLPVPSLVPLPLPTPLAHSTQTADTPLPFPPSLTVPTPTVRGTFEYR